ncbi:MAG: hypothetical protein AAF202_00350 [Pseudomonadota bacterium]
MIKTLGIASLALFLLSSPLSFGHERSCSDEIAGVSLFSGGGESAEQESTSFRSVGSAFATLRDLLARKDLKLKRKFRKRYQSALEHLEGDLRGVSADENTHAALIKQRYVAMADKLEQMDKFVASLGKSSEAIYYREILHAALAFVSVHSHEIVDMKSPNSFNLNRYLKIMKMISEFNSQTSEYSMYQVRAAILEEFSIREFIQCKI